MPSKHVFLCQVVNTWKVICSLVLLHALEKPYSNGTIVPGNVPLAMLALGQMVLKCKLGDFFDHIVVGVHGEHDHAVSSVCDLLSTQLPILIIFVTRCEPVRVI